MFLCIVNSTGRKRSEPTLGFQRTPRLWIDCVSMRSLPGLNLPFVQSFHRVNKPSLIYTDRVNPSELTPLTWPRLWGFYSACHVLSPFIPPPPTHNQCQLLLKSKACKDHCSTIKKGLGKVLIKKKKKGEHLPKCSLFLFLKPGNKVACMEATSHQLAIWKSLQFQGSGRFMNRMLEMFFKIIH